MANRSGSILAVDFGNVHTRAVLIDLVDGVYQLIASGETRTTSTFPDADIAYGLARATLQISQATGRRLLDNEGRLITPEQADRSGVDIVRFTASIGRPLRTVLIGLVPQMSIISAMRAAAGTYIQIVETLSLEDRRDPQAQLNAIILARPDLIFITGGTENGARELVLEQVNLAKLALRFGGSTGGAKPPILYAGNSTLIDEVREAFAGITDVFVAENARPQPELENLEDAQMELGAAYDSFAETRGLGFQYIAHYSDMGVLPTAQSYDVITEYMGKAALIDNRRAGGVLVADIGSAVSTLSASLKGKVATSIRTDIGLGHSAATLIDAVGLAAVRMWLPFNASDNEILAYAHNKTLHPAFVPESKRALHLEHALLRAALRGLLQASRPAWTTETAFDDPNAPMPYFSQIVGAGGAITRTGVPAMSAMLMLDALQPHGVVRLKMDNNALIPALGSLVRTNPEAVVQVIDAIGLEDLGTSVSLSGTPRANRPAVRVKVTEENGTVHQFTVNGGDFYAFPLGININAVVHVRVLGRGASIKTATGQKRAVKLNIEGGTAGLVIDARGRTLPVPENLRARASAITRWYAQASGVEDQAVEVPEEWLADLPSEAESTPQRARGSGRALKNIAAPTEAQPKGRGRRGKAEATETPVAPFEEEAAPQKDEDIDDLRNLFD